MFPAHLISERYMATEKHVMNELRSVNDSYNGIGLQNVGFVRSELKFAYVLTKLYKNQFLETVLRS